MRAALLHQIRLRRDTQLPRATLALTIATDSWPEHFLHPDEQRVAAGLQHALRHHSYLLGRYAAKLALGDWLGGIDARLILVDAGVFGQPVVYAPTASKPKVSISHSGDWAAALAFDEGHPMGVDLESIDATRTELILSQATAHERQLLVELPMATDDAACLLWSAKESLSKTLSTGLMCALELYEIESIKQEGDYLVLLFRHFAQYRAVSFRFDAMRCSITLPRRTEWQSVLICDGI